MTRGKLAMALVMLAAGAAVWAQGVIRDDSGTDIQPGKINPGGAVTDTKPAGKIDPAQFKQGNLLFVATIKQANAVAMTNSIPPSVLMEVTFKDFTMIRGAEPKAGKFNYSTRGAGGASLVAGGKYVVAANEAQGQAGIIAMAEATDENLKAVGAIATTGPSSAPTSSPASAPSTQPASAPAPVDAGILNRLR